MGDYKSVLVKNNTTIYQVELFVYSRYDPLCWLSSLSKILSPGKFHLYRSETGFKFEIKKVLHRQKKTVVCVRKWIKDTNFTVHDDDNITETDLDDHVLEKSVSIRRINFKKEASLKEGKNLYEILKLNFDEIRQLDKKEQDEKIKKAFQREIRRWHSDIVGELGDNELVHEVMVAYDILRDRSKRASYNNKADHSKGWLSIDRWRSIFWPECDTLVQKNNYRKRLLMMAMSLGIGISGLLLATSGIGLPALAALSGTVGAGCFGGGVQSFLRTTSVKSIEQGCDTKDYLKTFAFGFAAGAVTGGSAVGITAGISSIGSTATEAAITPLVQYTGISCSSAIAGAAVSVAGDAEKKFVDNVDVTMKQVICHAGIGAVTGSLTGAAVSAVSSFFPVIRPSGGERLFPQIKKVTVLTGENVIKKTTGRISTASLTSVANFVEERLDDEQENRPIGSHLKEAGKRLISNVILDTATTACTVVTEASIHNLKQKGHTTDAYDLSESQDKKIRYGVDRHSHKLHNESGRETYVNIQEPKVSITDEDNSSECQEKKDRYGVDRNVHKSQFQLTKLNLKTGSGCNPTPQTKIIENTTVNPNMTELEDYSTICSRFRYIADGSGISKMIVEFKFNGISQIKTMRESGSGIELPIDAEDVKVHFKVLRFLLTWCDVKKWDRLKKVWHEEPHIFSYKSPPEQRTFTLSGPLYFEGVINVTNENHDEVCDM